MQILDVWTICIYTGTSMFQVNSRFCNIFLDSFLSVLKIYQITILYKRNSRKNFKVFLFVCVFWGVFVPLEYFPLLWRRYHCRWRAANFYLPSELMAIEQWGFFSLLNLLWHGSSVYNVTLTPIAERLAVDLSQHVFTTQFCHYWDSYSQPSACEATAAV